MQTIQQLADKIVQDNAKRQREQFADKLAQLVFTIRTKPCG